MLTTAVVLAHLVGAAVGLANEHASEPVPARRGGRNSTPSKLDQLTRAFGKQVASAIRDRRVADEDVVFVLRSSPEVPDELAQRVARLTAHQLQALGFRTLTRHAPAAGGALARQLSGQGFELMLDCTLVRRPRELQLRGELRELASDFWRSLTNPPDESSGYLVAAVIAADDALGLVDPPSGAGRRRFALTRYASPLCPLHALVSVQLGSTGRAAIVALASDQLAVFRFADRARGYVMRYRSGIVGPPAKIAPRRMVATLVRATTSATTDQLLLRLSSKAQALRVAFEGDATRHSPSGEAFPLGLIRQTSAPDQELRGVLREGMDLFESASLTLGGKPLAGEKRALLPASFYRLKVAHADGAPDADLIALVDTEGRLRLLDTRLEREVATVERAGVAFALGDLDADGKWEVVTSSAGPSDGEDELTLYRLRADGALVVLSRHRALGGVVSAITQGDFDGDGRIEVVALVNGNDGKCTLLQLD
jgi:hypothetical protein